MTTTDTYPPPGYRSAGDRIDGRPGMLSQVWSGLGRGVDWLDGHGRKAWVFATVGGFLVAPPLGVVILLFSLGTGRMFSSRHNDRHAMSKSCGWGRRGDARGAWEGRMRSARSAMRPSGNAAFDSYKAETLRRLEEEQHQFEEFLARLREARDKAEFDQFMEDRARRAEDRTRSDDQPEAA